MALAVEVVRRMRGGTQPFLIRCADGGYYVVKFQNNPQHVRVLANELLGTRLAARLGLPTAPAEVVEVRQELIDLAAELVVRVGLSSTPCRPGLQFGSRYPGDPARVAVYDFLPDERLVEVNNLADFLGILVFDKWTCNTDGRQAIFFLGPGRSGYQARMIDQGFCFNGGEWNFPDAPLRGLYARHRVYASVRGIESFEPWLERLERIDGNVLDRIAKEIPPAWYEGRQDALYQLLERLLRRRQRVPQLIRGAIESREQAFRAWK